MMHSSAKDIELCSIDRFGSIEPNFLQKKKIRKISRTVHRDKIELVRLSPVRFDSVRNFI